MRCRGNEFLTIVSVMFVLHISAYSWGYIAFYGITILMIVRIGSKIQTNLMKNYFNLFFIPYIMILMHAFINMFIYHETFFAFRALNNFVHAVSYILFAYCFYILHGNGSIRIILDGAVSYYMIKLIEAFIFVGPIDFMKNILIPGSVVLTKWLEAHDIGLSFGSILLYYFFYEKYPYKRRKILVIASSVIFYLCWKRIAIAAFLVCAVFIVLFNKILDKKKRCITLWGIIGVMICLAYVYLIKSEMLIGWFNDKGINTQGRNSLYRFIEHYYQFSLRFWGRGDGYTGKLLTDLARSGNGIGKIVALHSDILRAFVEYGFLGSILWYSYYLIYLPGKFKRKNRKMCELLFVMAMYLFIIYLTDNASGYMLCQILYILLPLQYAVKENKVVTDKYG